MRLQYFEKSITSAAPTVCPASEEPPPRGKIGTPWLAASSTAAIDVVGRLRNDHADRLDLVVGGVGRIEHAGGAVETDFAADARGQLGLEHPGSLDRGPAGLRFGVDPPDPLRWLREPGLDIGGVWYNRHGAPSSSTQRREALGGLLCW